MTPDLYPTTRKLLGPFLAALILVGIAYHKDRLFVPPADAGEYHLNVEQAALDIPFSLGPWVGVDEDVPQAARALLKPNVLVSRRYSHVNGREWASLLFVHTRDARDLIGHFPPFCYRGAGYVLEAMEERDWLVGDLPVHGKRYHFKSNGSDRRSSIVVDNFMVLPEGSIARDMDGVNRSAQDVRQRHFGAAQVQVLTDAGMSSERRDEVFIEMVKGCVKTIRSMSSGVEAR